MHEFYLALVLALKQRLGATRKRPVFLLFSGKSVQLFWIYFVAGRFLDYE